MPIKERQAVTYQVKTEDGLSLRISEVELVPTAIVRDDPVTSLAGLQQEGYPLFLTRSELITAHAELIRQGGGMNALLSSRIDMLPHQLYVVGVVLQDRLRRYILADEVGLGKTVEAGIIVQDLLSGMPRAKVLVLCPGSLTQQWLCEFYTKFSTRVFTLLDLHHNPDLLTTEQRRNVIAPLHAVSGPHSNWLEDNDWDLVVVDEVHHLLISEEAYRFVSALSAKVPSILLLSALPAQQRKTEFLKLLALLEPDRYGESIPEHFDLLYDAQPNISRQLRRLRQRLEEESPDCGEIIEVANNIRSIPALSSDVTLQAHAQGLEISDPHLLQKAWVFLSLAAERGRINRRILRNRRARLVEDGLIKKTRRFNLLESYDPGQPELDAIEAALRLIRAAKHHTDPFIWSAFGRLLMQSFAHPETAWDIVVRMSRIGDVTQPVPLEALGHIAGYAGWDRYCNNLFAIVRPNLTTGAIEEAVDAVLLWKGSRSAVRRLESLIELLEKLELKYKKLVLFAGFPGLVEHLVPSLIEVFESDSVCEFHGEMERKEKEDNIHRFRTDPSAWLLVCDESGGEGRNFQFAGAVVHYDTPWYVSRIEQRIGRLDRLGRLRPEVPTCVQFARGTPEEEIIRYFAEGFRVYDQSVSGLEFALTDFERDVVGFVFDPGEQTPDEFIAGLSERVEQERARDENEAVLDEVSFNREAASKYKRGQTLAEAEVGLETAFTEYLRKVSTGDSARQRADREFPNGIWELDATQFQHIKVDIPKSDATGSVGAVMRGTFRRSIAQERLDLQFFSVGNPLFDSVMEAVRTQQSGRVYAIDMVAAGQPEWCGFEFIFVTGADAQSLKGNPGLASRAMRLFTLPPLHIFVDHDLKISNRGEDFLKLRRGLSPSDKDRTWWNLTKQKADRATIPFGGQDQWQLIVPRAYAAALTEATQIYKQRFQPKVDAESEILREQIRQAIENDPAEAASLEQLDRAINRWMVTLDSAGFLSVNGKLGRAR